MRRPPHPANSDTRAGRPTSCDPPTGNDVGGHSALLALVRALARHEARSIRQNSRSESYDEVVPGRADNPDPRG